MSRTDGAPLKELNSGPLDEDADVVGRRGGGGQTLRDHRRVGDRHDRIRCEVRAVRHQTAVPLDIRILDDHWCAPG